eukprot:TRINITY_DN6515_c0_g1_i1.p1 TRINITY_DN6515_c0_g1~~TRINITY_DN6515_c0_g1_i1.p1  ORF type:complete len:1177 (+),score=479.47 TRINITY_DN6515_c0_g1_i1:127-3657(+)
MFIEEIVIDGFKSYATRTVVNGFDPTFNAITGLNGSGKSNILDSICFVLGITNLSQVRASSLQELVYKQGQAGVTKASVTIVFNNENTAQSPVGYEQYDKITVTRQVVIGGRNKYLINGHNAQANRVQNLFHSVQLNVNNPHFLIMQGKINKVIHMKPPEILAMIEEAAGTRMFEMKKQSALKTIAKKDKKVEEITKVLAEEITPTLENLRKERAHYMKWTSNQTEIERMSRFVVAYEYTKAQETLSTSNSDLKKLDQQQATMAGRREELNENLAALKKKLATLSEQKEKEMGTDFKNLESAVSKLQKALVKLQSEYEHTKETCDAEEQKVVELTKSTKEITESIKNKNSELEDAKKSAQKIEDSNKSISENLEDLQRKYHAASAGLSSDAGETKSMADKLMDAKREAVNAATEAKTAQMKIKHITTELKDKKKASQIAGKEYTSLQNEHEVSSKETAKLKKALEDLQFDENTEKDLLVKRRQEESKVAELRERLDALGAQLSGLQFVYSPPEKNFDRNRVKGLIAELISVKNGEATLALEVTAGGRLFFVVVDNEQTGKLLLSKGNLARRVTMIPLNKINRKTVDARVIKAAEKLVGKENVNVAQNMVGYDKELEPAMDFVFGNTLICKDSETARQVTFHQDIRTKSVTLEGDVFDPMGTLTGGSRPTTNSVLVQVQQFNEAKKQLDTHEKELQRINNELSAMREVAEKYRVTKQKYELKAHETELLHTRLSQSSHYQLLEKIKEMETQLEQATASIDSLKQKEIASNKAAEELEQQMNNFESVRDKQLKEIESAMNEAKNRAQASTKELKKRRQQVEQVTLEIDELKKELATTEEQIKATQANIAKMNKEVEKKEQVVAEKKTEFDDAEAELQKKRENVLATDKTINNLITDRDRVQKEMTDNDIEIKKIEHKLSRYHKDQKDAAKFVEHLEEKHPWVSNEKQYFGKPHTDYDFKARDPQEAHRMLTNLQDEQGKLSKQINKKVMSMFEKAEQEYKELMEKKQIIENDKAKIEAVIAELDEKKNEALKTTWLKVNRDFGSIFSTLLPGTTAKLEPPEGGSVLDGLEMKVAFGTAWKESLSELSGGQRSLLALSLILALLLFKPAPMYILDEIDAALDLSHTQNIGQMLKNHFTHSQFIVVSLKEDMFNNANVLFKTKFVDGVSCVQRIRNKSGK